ncbi:hypothetical protein [Actinoplanes sp. M2I2]|uniref:hypothetical protein n=1 Tax=Actinoplanes sp. M2I2 TaxID=1734444 RepID=UPI0020205E2E|nr:hypothetical protein [Actinoplanes sp. M2I2]
MLGYGEFVSTLSIILKLVALIIPAAICLVGFRMLKRIAEVGDHSPARIRRRHSRARSARRTGSPPEAHRVVRSHPVSSDRLMDLSTTRLRPSTRHRVPPWVQAAAPAGEGDQRR